MAAEGVMLPHFYVASTASTNSRGERDATSAIRSKASSSCPSRFVSSCSSLMYMPVDTVAAALESKSFFIRHIGTDGYRIGPKPKLNKVMADRRASLDDQRDVRPACLKLVKDVFEQGATLPVIPFPEDAASIQDTPRLVLVTADPATDWDRSGVRQQIAEWTLRRGASARLYSASLIWCIRKSGRDLADRVESWLAWQRVQRDLVEGVLGQDIEAEERQEVQAKAKEALNAAKDAVWADFRFVVFADNGEPDRIRAIDLGAGHSSSNETLSGRVLAALKSQGLLNETVGAGYIQRKWPPALADAGAWPLTGLRQSFLDGSLTRLLDPDKVLRTPTDALLGLAFNHAINSGKSFAGIVGVKGDLFGPNGLLEPRPLILAVR
jgi:hypothetical protein